VEPFHNTITNQHVVWWSRVVELMHEVSGSNRFRCGDFAEFSWSGWLTRLRWPNEKMGTKEMNAWNQQRSMCSLVVKVPLTCSCGTWFEFESPEFFSFFSLFFPYIILFPHDFSNEIFYLTMIISNYFNLLIMRK
jgi:hypothetical protein